MDILDARVLTRYGQVCPGLDPCPSETGEKGEILQLLLRRRLQLVDQWSRNGTGWKRVSALPSVSLPCGKSPGSARRWHG